MQKKSTWTVWSYFTQIPASIHPISSLLKWIPTGKLTYPTLEKRKIIFKSVFGKGYLWFPGGYTILWDLNKKSCITLDVMFNSLRLLSSPMSRAQDLRMNDSKNWCSFLWDEALWMWGMDRNLGTIVKLLQPETLPSNFVVDFCCMGATFSKLLGFLQYIGLGSNKIWNMRAMGR